jgi:hypothetical protein
MGSKKINPCSSQFLIGCLAIYFIQRFLQSEPRCNTTDSINFLSHFLTFGRDAESHIGFGKVKVNSTRELGMQNSNGD